MNPEVVINRNGSIYYDKKYIKKDTNKFWLYAIGTYEIVLIEQVLLKINHILTKLRRKYYCI